MQPGRRFVEHVQHARQPRPQQRSKPEPLFLIVSGALTAVGLPFALAFPRTLLEKLGGEAWKDYWEAYRRALGRVGSDA